MRRKFGHWSSRVNQHRLAGLRHGFRSGLEEKNAELLEANKVPVRYETRKIKYSVPASLRTYTPDFELPNGIIVETKGLWEQQDRAKLLFITTQYPKLDLRLVFSRAATPIYKGSKTDYGTWATDHGFKWAEKLIPVSWLKEPGPGLPLDAILSAPAFDLSHHPARQPHAAVSP